MSEQKDSNVTDKNRRGILVTLTGIGALLFAGFGYMAFEYIRSSKLPRATNIIVSNTKELFAGKKNTTIQFNGRKVFVQQRSETEFIAHSMICTHGSCTVEWQERSSLFLCPCHNGAFNSDGTVLRKPPERPLVALKTTYDVAKDQLTIIETEL